jgi:hypothetical protein
LPGEMIGLFEAADLMSGVANPPAPSWNIRAGVSSIYATASLETEGMRKKFEKKLGIKLDAASFNAATTLLQLLQLLEPYSNIQNSWRTRVIYFSNSWLSLANHGKEEAANGRLREHFMLRAWKNLARARDKDPTPLQRKLKRLPPSNQGKVSEKQRVERSIAEATAGLLMKRALDVVEGRQPCYIPTKEDSALGPFGAISNNILAAVTASNWVLVPTYSPPSGVGYMKLDHVVPSLSDADELFDKINTAMGVIRLASKRELNEVAARRELDVYISLLGRLTFQLKSKPSPNRHLFRFDEKLTNIIISDVSKDNFYKPYFIDAPPETNTFFKSSIRIET